MARIVFSRLRHGAMMPRVGVCPARRGSDTGCFSKTSSRHEEAEFNSSVPIDEQHGEVIRGIFFLDDIGWDDFPLAILQVLPLVRPIFADPETGFVDVAIVTARSPGNTKSLSSSRVHFLFVEPFVVRHRWVMGVNSNGKQSKETKDHQRATERFHGSLRDGLSPNLTSANHTNRPATNQAITRRKMESHFRAALLFEQACCFSARLAHRRIRKTTESPDQVSVRSEAIHVLKLAR
jgi:hypothetical protein